MRRLIIPKKIVLGIFLLATIATLVTSTPLFGLHTSEKVCVAQLDCGFDPVSDYATLERFGQPVPVVTYKTIQSYGPTTPGGELAILTERSRDGAFNYAGLIVNWLVVAAVLYSLVIVWRVATKGRHANSRH